VTDLISIFKFIFYFIIFIQKRPLSVGIRNKIRHCADSPVLLYYGHGADQ
jgi:hypothetical protein